MPISRAVTQRAWADCGITGLTITTEQPEAMELMAAPPPGLAAAPVLESGDGEIETGS